MLIWILIAMVLIITIFFVIKSIFSKNADSSQGYSFSSGYPDIRNPNIATPPPVIRKLKGVDVLPNVKIIKANREFNWLKLHQNINPRDNTEIQAKLTKLIHEEREYIIIDKFIYFTELNPDKEILEILDEVEKTTLSYREILRRLGNK